MSYLIDLIKMRKTKLDNFNIMKNSKARMKLNTKDNG